MSGEIITPESLAGIQTQLDAAFGEVEAYITESETMAVESLNTLVAQGYLSEEQASELLRKTQESYDAQEKIISDNKARINEILTQASEENRALTAEEAAEIKQLMEESNAAAEATYLANVTDREQYVKDLMNQEEEWDAQRLSNVIQLANDIRDEEVAAAQKKYDESVAAANTLYYDLGAITEEEYNKMIAKAEEDRDKEVAAAEDKRAKTVAEAKGMAGDVANAVDSESGVIFSKWEQLWNKMWGKVKSIINSIIDAINSVISGTFSVGVTVADWLGLDFTEENIPKIPRLARGGVIPGGRSFLAVLGDQPKGQTNIEAPLQTIVDAFNIALSQNGGYSGNTEVVLEIDGREFGRAVVEKGNQESRRIGTRLAVT